MANLKMIAGVIIASTGTMLYKLSALAVSMSKSRADSIIRSAGAEKMHPVILIFAEPE